MKQAIILDYYTDLPENIQNAFDCVCNFFGGEYIQEIPTSLNDTNLVHAVHRLSYDILKNWLNCNTPAGVTILVQT